VRGDVSNPSHQAALRDTRRTILLLFCYSKLNPHVASSFIYLLSPSSLS
jgi:hypothetical protein